MNRREAAQESALDRVDLSPGAVEARRAWWMHNRDNGHYPGCPCRACEAKRTRAVEVVTDERL